MNDNATRIAAFHQQVNAMIADPETNTVMMPGYDADVLVLNGYFALEELEKIVETWKAYKEQLNIVDAETT